MAQLELNTQERSEIGGNHPRRLRREGLIPAVLYGGGEAPVSLALPRTEYKKESGHLHENQIVNLQITAGGETRARATIIKTIQVDHLSGAILHIDFQRISLSEKLTATVAVEAIGEAIGVTRDGGVLEHILREIEIWCLPADLPKAIEVDVSSLEIGDTLHVRDIPVPGGIEILTEPEISIFTLAAPISEEEAAPQEITAETPEGAPAGEPAGEEKEENE